MKLIAQDRYDISARQRSLLNFNIVGYDTQFQNGVACQLVIAQGGFTVKPPHHTERCGITEMKTLLLIDGNSILNRAYYGIRPLTTSTGLYTHAVYGMVNILLKHIDEKKPDYIAAAFDLKAPTFRHKMYDGYKANRKGMPEELAMQLPYAREAVRALGITIIEKEGYEADDILGTAAQSVNSVPDLQSYILTGDRDSFQLIRDNITVLYASTGETINYDRTAFGEKYPGVTPEQFVDVKALMGDSSDNIPGVSGIGEKTALKLISEFSSLDNLYANLDNAGLKPAAYKKLCEGKDSAYLSRELAQIKTDVPLGITPEELKYFGPNSEKCIEIFSKLELLSVLKRLKLSASKPEDKKSHKESADSAIKTDGETGSENNGDPGALNNSYESDKEERHMPALKINDDFSAVIYNGASASSIEIDRLRELLADRENSFVVYDSKHIYNKIGSKNVGCKFFDIMLAAYVINSSDNDYSLPRLAIKYLGTFEDDDRNDAEIIYNLYPILKEKLKETDQLKLYSDIELPLARILSEMELKGSKIDRTGLEDFLDKLTGLCNQYANEIYDAAGCTFNLNSPKQLGEVLFEKLALPSSKKTKLGYSTDAETLEKLRPYSVVVDRLLEYRMVSKLKSTYAEGLLKALDGNSRVHTKFNQTVTATGRLSSTDPNLQNIPIRQPLGREIRRFFIPENENYIFIDADYSQIELRLLAAISGDEKMTNAFLSGEDIHTHTAAQIFGIADSEVTPEQRKRAKAVNFGIVYGIGAYSLSQDIGVPVYQAKEYIQNYLDNYPKVQKYLKDIVEKARQDGFVTTMFGRRRYIPELSSPKKQLQAFGERVALNSPIQGTAADIIKIAMINVAKSLSENNLDAKIILQVHDEIIIESNKSCADKAAEILKYEMENAVKLSVPMSVETGTGKTWFEC